MLSSLHKRYFRVIGISALIAVGLFLVSISVWERYLAAVGYETLQGIIAIMCVSLLFLHQSRDYPTTPILMSAGLVYFAIIEVGGAIEKLIHQIPPTLQKTHLVLSSDLIQNL